MRASSSIAAAALRLHAGRRADLRFLLGDASSLVAIFGAGVTTTGTKVTAASAALRASRRHVNSCCGVSP